MIRQDNQSAGKDVLGFLQFSSEGKVIVKNSDASIEQTENNCKDDVEHIAFSVPGSSARTENLYLTYQDGKIKEVLVQHYQDGAWLRDKLTFLLSSDESTCYVQHMHSDVEISPSDSSTATDFDLETCRLADDVGNDPLAQAAVLKNGGLSSMKSCETDLAKSSLAHYYENGANAPDATFHTAPTVQPSLVPQSQASPQCK